LSLVSAAVPLACVAAARRAAGLLSSLLVVANAAATPALAAAQYLNLYVRAVRLRERAVTTRRQIETRNAASRAVQEDAAHRLQALQAEVIPLLTDVASRRAEADDPQVASTARRLASRSSRGTGRGLQRQLAAAFRTLGWIRRRARRTLAWHRGTGPGPALWPAARHRPRNAFN
jgi:hypothetical protein